MEEYTLPERKAFVDWFNNEFYKKIVDKREGREITKKIYQEMLKDYLNTETPYRGALVYHGLGTGKTATAITVTEGLKSDWEIVTILPPSLESNFVEEIKKFGDPLFRIFKDSVSRWVYIEKDDIPKEISKFTDQYSLTGRFMTARASEINNMYKTNVKPGLWLEMGDTGGSGGKTYSELSESEKEHLNKQITKMIEMKYNFIGYDSFPDFNLRRNKSRKPTSDHDKFLTRLVREGDAKGTPFNKKVVIIDEVHGFISQVFNKLNKEELVRSSLVYSWLMNADECKIVCLSGTPIVNRPSEIALLVNMLKGTQKVYTFELENMSEQEYVIFIDFIRHTVNGSPIKQFLLEKQGGKTLLSIIRNPPNFISVLGAGGVIKTTRGDNNMSDEEFVINVYDSISEKYKILSPKKKEIKKLLTSAPNDFHKVLNTFTILDRGKVYDCTDNNVFLDMFFDPTYNLRQDKKELLLRMCSGCVSYYPSSDDVVSDEMADKNKPEEVLERYEKYKCTEFINIVDCPMPYRMFEAYELERNKERDTLRQTRNGKKIYNMEFNKAEAVNNNSYHIKSRILCTTAASKDHNVKQILEDPELLAQYSPKLTKLIDIIKTNGNKCMIYSQFIENGGLNNVEILLKLNDIDYRKITGGETKKQKQKNLDEFNNTDIQVILISESGKEGISLSNVREVHIIEPYWNFTRIQQVIGRAIRKGSHNDLDISDRNVSIYLYIAALPDEKDPEVLAQVPEEEQVSLSLRISNLKVQDPFGTMDQYLLDMMETKYKITEQCKKILIEASIDCKQNATGVNGVTCLDYSKLLKNEDTIFPGISNSRLGNINPIQIKIKGIKKGTIYMVEGKTLKEGRPLLLYFNISKQNVRERDLKDPVAIISYDTGRALISNRDCFKDPPPNFECIGNVIQVPEKELTEENPSYSRLENLIEENIIGYKLKFKNGKEYFANIDLSNTIEERKFVNILWDWNQFEVSGYDQISLQTYSYRAGKIYKSRNVYDA